MPGPSGGELLLSRYDPGVRPIVRDVCGRYVLASSLPELARFFSASYDEALVAEHRPSWNVPPGRSVLAVVADGSGGRRISELRWGLVPSWARDRSIGARTFNARAETVATTPSFRASFKRRRALVVADAFYEWSKLPEDRRQPYLLYRADGDPLAFAGLWDEWRPREQAGQGPLRTCTIITTSAGADLGGIHERQPVVLEKDAFDAWLDPGIQDRAALEGLLRPSPPGTLTRRRVGRAVGRAEVDGPELIEAV